MKKLVPLLKDKIALTFWSLVGALGVTFVLTIVFAVKEHREKESTIITNPEEIPLPASQ